MKKQFFITLLLALIIILTSALNVFAEVYAVGDDTSTATVTLKTSKTEVKPGDTFTVTVSAAYSDGFEGFDSFLTYDKDKLEYQKTEGANNTWGTIMAEDVSGVTEHAAKGYQYSLSAAASDKKENDDVMIITFKVKENATNNSTANITFNEIKVVGSDESNTSHNVGTKTTSVKIASSSNAVGTGNNSTNQAGETKTETIKDKSATQSNTSMPKTGRSLIIVTGIGLATIATIVTYKFFRKYKNI